MRELGRIRWTTGLGMAALLCAAAPMLQSCSQAIASDVDASTDPDNWTGFGRTAGEQHFSPLSEIDSGNVERLGLAWSMDLPQQNSVSAPLAIDGTSISIRKFSAKPITLDMLCQWGAMSQKMCTALKIAGASRFNIVISGGTGSGKTTMLNALSKMIDPGERVLTIEDAAELRLQQPHWLPLETRPANLEGNGAIHMGDLVKNALRMRPDRIIMGEVRGAECFDLLAAMNTGHDGSMCTLHSNSPRECLGRMENMVLMGDIKIPKEAISKQIADSVDLIVQIKRLRDGSRRVTNVTEVIGMEGDVIVTQELFKFEYLDEDKDGKIVGEYRAMGLRPYTLEKARQYGFDQPYLEACL